MFDAYRGQLGAAVPVEPSESLLDDPTAEGSHDRDGSKLRYPVAYRGDLFVGTSAGSNQSQEHRLTFVVQSASFQGRGSWFEGFFPDSILDSSNLMTSNLLDIKLT